MLRLICFSNIFLKGMTLPMYLVSTPYEFDLTPEDVEGIEDLFYTKDKGFGANIQSRASGALIQQLIAISSIADRRVVRPTPNSQLNKLAHLGQTLHTYIESIAHIRLHDQALKNITGVPVSREERLVYQRIKRPKNKDPTAVDFPYTVFPTEPQPGDIDQMQNVMLELKCSFPTNDEQLAKAMSDAEAISNFNKSLKSATGTMANRLRPCFMELLLIFDMYEVRSRSSARRPFRLRSLNARWVMLRKNQARATTFSNHIERHNVLSIADIVDRPGYVLVNWENGQQTVEEENQLELSHEALDALKVKKRKKTSCVL